MHNIGKNYLYRSGLSKHVRKLEMGKTSQRICEVNKWHKWTTVSRLSTLFVWLFTQNLMHKRWVQWRYIYKFYIINVFVSRQKYTTVTDRNLTGGRTLTYFDLLWQPNYLNTCTCTNKHVHVYIYCLLL